MVYVCLVMVFFVGSKSNGIDNKEEGKIIFNIHNTSEQSDQFPPYKCYQMQGEGLKQCFCCLLREEKKATFKKFPPEVRRMALKQLTLGDYREFLNTWSEKEWSDLVVSLTDEEKKRFPKTIKVQQKKLDAIEVKVNRLSSISELGIGYFASLVPGLQAVRICAQFGYLFKYGSFPTTQALRSHYYHLFLEEEFGISWQYS